jgi:hypothetical protein
MNDGLQVFLRTDKGSQRGRLNLRPVNAYLSGKVDKLTESIMDVNPPRYTTMYNEEYEHPTSVMQRKLSAQAASLVPKSPKEQPILPFKKLTPTRRANDRSGSASKLLKPRSGSLSRIRQNVSVTRLDNSASVIDQVLARSTLIADQPKM